ncbi:MAG: response regulator [Polyangiaceae bacterium]
MSNDAQERGPTARAHADAPRASSLRGRLEGMRVLLVDDEQDSCELTAFVLRKAGAHATVAFNLADALTLFDELKPDLVMTDLTFPDGEDPFAFLVALRERRSDLPVIVLSGNTASDKIEEVRAAGFQTFLAKPVTLDALVSAVAVFKPSADTPR